MSNLSDLLPAGASAKQITATDSGSGIATKKPVILNSDGTVTEVSSSSVLNGTVSNFISASGAFSAVAYDTTNNQGLVVYRDNNAAIKGQIITVDSSNNITYGTATTIHTASNTADTTAVYDSTHQRYVVMFKDENSYGQARTLSPSGTGGSATFTVGNATYFPVSAINDIRSTFLDSCFDPDTGQVIVAFADTTNSNHFYMSVGEVRTSPEDIQWGTAVAVDTGGACSSFSVTYDTTANRVLALWELDGTSGKAVVGTVTSGTIGSFGSVVNYTSNPYKPGAAYNVDNNCIGILFRNDAVSSYLYAIGAKVDGSDNSVVFGTEVAVTSEYSGSSPQGVTYSTAMDKFTFAYYLTAGYQYRNFNVSSAATPVVTLDAAVTFPSTSDGQYANYYDPDEDAVVFTWRRGGGPWGAQAITPSLTNLTAQAFVGVADSAISASAAGSVIVQGGTVTGPTTSVEVAENVGSNIPWGDQTKANYTPRAAYGSDDVLIAYSINDGVTVGARVVAGTIGGGTISFGTDAVISADASVSTTRYTVVYDSTNDTYIVSWLDAGDSYKMYAAVVSLTGNSISYGGTTAIVSTANIGTFGGTGSVYDPDTQRVIFTYCSTVDNYTYAVVCEASSTAITTVGTPAKIDSSSANNGYANRVSVCYDTTENKVIASYCYLGGGGTYYLRAAAGTVNGGTNSITWGSSVPVLSGEGTYISSAYNATDQRVVFSYQSATLTGYLNSSVASVSGTTITVGGTVSVITTGTNYYSSVAHDATANKMVTYYRGATGPSVASGAIDTATNTITYSTPTVLLSGTRNFEDTLYDPTTGKCILISSGASAGQTSCNIYTTAATLTGQPLTTGTKYYVTTTGGFSSTAGSPSVNAGLAISTTSLLLNGDS